MGVCVKYELRTETHLRNVLRYLGNHSHPHHAEYEIPTANEYGALTTADFVAKTVAAVEEINQRRRDGRPTKNLATLFIDRFADGTDLTAEEEDFHERSVLECVAEGTSGVVYRHRNRETLSIDFNFLVPNVLFGAFPLRTRRTARKDPLATMKEASNASVDQLNELRRQQGKRLIVRVSDRKRQLARLRRGKLIEQELAEHGNVTSANIRGVLEGFGHRVTRFSLERDTISIITRGSKQPRRFSLGELLDAGGEISKEIHIGEDRAEEFQNFETPRDLHLRRLAGHSGSEASEIEPM